MTALVAKGDPTTTRGEVLSGSSTQYDEENRPLAVDLDWASCGECKGGPFRIFGSVGDWTDEGRKMVKDLDPVNCPCRRNRVLAKRQDYLIEQGGGSAKREAPATVVRKYDEQVRAIGQGAMEGYPYFIETADGYTEAGRLDTSALLSRITTETFGEYTVYWGDEALAHEDWQ